MFVEKAMRDKHEIVQVEDDEGRCREKAMMEKGIPVNRAVGALHEKKGERKEQSPADDMYQGFQRMAVNVCRLFHGV